jgi:hypothetical protein
MKRLIFALLCIAMLCTSAAAHSGRTDENGGHTDHSTGEYHYHHGYPAHQHKDMDGDGKKDCPYEFDDKTDHKESESDSHESASHKVEEEKPKGDSASEKWASAKRIVKTIFHGIGIALGLITMLYMAYFFVLVLIEAMQKWFKKK